MPLLACLVSLHLPHSPGELHESECSQISWWYYFPITACESLKSGPNQETRYNSQMLYVWFSLYPAIFFFIFPVDSLAELEFRSVNKQWASRIPGSQAKNSSSVENNKDLFCNSWTLGVRWWSLCWRGTYSLGLGLHWSNQIIKRILNTAHAKLFPFLP